MKWSNLSLALIVSALFFTSSTISSEPPVVPKVVEIIPIKRENIPTLSEKQTNLLSAAYQIAKKDGHLHPQVLQGIMMMESKAGTIKSYKVAGQEYGLKANERYYGVCQIKLAAARETLRRYPKLWQEFHFQTKTDEEIIAKLIENDIFNLSIASKYLLVLKAAGYDTIAELSLAYKQGPAGAKAHDPESSSYSVSVMKIVQSLRPEKS